MGRRKMEPKKLGPVLVNAIQMAEELFADVPKSGKAKKEWVVDFVNSHVNLPLLNERQEERLLSLTVDVLCALVMKRVL
jgi:hypothetical protein|tara:strand:- start:509 stop:745 length:237 start_codon:yes stop_codon:yes gene_type:complete